MESPELRRRTMQAVKSANTSPEMKVRRLLHSHGYRYRLHVKNLPGSPDIVFPSRRKIISIHGCFWHGHNCARGSRIPKTHTEYWAGKIARNRQRDARNKRQLMQMGWRVLVIWECRINSSTLAKLERFLD